MCVRVCVCVRARWRARVGEGGLVGLIMHSVAQGPQDRLKTKLKQDGVICHRPGDLRADCSSAGFFVQKP